MSRMHAVAAVGAALLLVSACGQDNPGLSERPHDDPPSENTPAADATTDIDESLIEYYTQTIDWERCDGEFDCATVTVPLDYDDPGDESVELSILRSPATGDADPLGSLLVNPGGPGGSGVDYARTAQSIVTEDVLERYDVVGFDPRGVGRSDPIECVGNARLDEFTAADGAPDDDAAVEAMQAAVVDFGAACQEQSGDLLAHMSTVDVARDLDVLRAVLGDEQLTYLGKSYGTVIGARYADMFPDRVGRMVLDGAMDPSSSIDEVALGQAAGFEDAFEAFVAWCVEQSSCSLGSSPEAARQAMTDLLDRADADPLPTGREDRPLTESLAFAGVALPLYYPADQGYPMLDAALGPAIEDGDGSALVELSDLYLDRTSDGHYRSNMNEAALAVNCLDRGDPDTTAAQTRAGLTEFTAASPTFGEQLAWSDLTCAQWPHHPESPPVPVTASGADPIVVVGTTGDPATPYAWSEALASQLESAVLLTYEGFMHTAYMRAGNECVNDAVDAYLLDGQIPAADTRCS